MKQRILLLISLGIIFGCTKSRQSENKQSDKKSEINEKKDDEKFPLQGWKIIGSSTTDFNGDDSLDIAYVIEEDNETTSKEDECKDEPFHKKELVIKFGQKDGSFQTNFNTSKIFGKCIWGIQGTDAFGGIRVRKNTLNLSFITGGTLRSALSYYFRHQNNDWFLIGYEEITYQIPYENKYIKEINYLTGKKVVYEMVNGKSSPHKISDIGKNTLIKLDELDASEHNTAGQE